MIRLESVDESNWREELNVAEEQKCFVSDQFKILARAFAYREHNSRAYMICYGELTVGMAMFYDCEELQAYDLSQFFIDERYQCQGFGREALRQILDVMCEEGRFDKVCLCYIEGNEAARRLYAFEGFVETDRDGNEIIMERVL